MGDTLSAKNNINLQPGCLQPGTLSIVASYGMLSWLQATRLQFKK
jgi:hypothetical protein